MHYHTWKGERTIYGKGYDDRLLGKPLTDFGPFAKNHGYNEYGTSYRSKYNAGWYDADRDLAATTTPRPGESLHTWRERYTFPHAPSARGAT